MPDFGGHSIKRSIAKSERRKEKKAYWMAKGCSEQKAEALLYRYGY